MANPIKFKAVLRPEEMPTRWYNVLPDLAGLEYKFEPYLHPVTLKPLTPEDLKPLFPMALIEQELSSSKYIPIPEEVLNILSLWRSTPLLRARRLEEKLKTPAKIFYKYEGASPAGSHKPNTAVAQAYYNKAEGIKRLTTETGAGQWGSALSLACQLFGLQCQVYMVRVSYEQKPYRKMMMHTWGADVVPSPSTRTNAGRAILAADPNSSGSLGIAISEAVEDAATHDDTHYALGSVLNHVILHQSIIGLETDLQLRMLGVKPDVMIGCVGGGSNFGGFVVPFVERIIAGEKIRLVAVEPTACPTLTRGPYTYDYGDTAKMAPVAKMYTLGHTFMPSPIHAGGLRYHGDSPIVSLLVKNKISEAVAYDQTKVFESAIMFARTEGLIPAPETSHAIACAIDEAVRAREEGKEKNIVFNFSGHADFDLASYQNFLDGKIEDQPLSEDVIQKALVELPKV